MAIQHAPAHLSAWKVWGDWGAASLASFVRCLAICASAARATSLRATACAGQQPAWVVGKECMRLIAGSKLLAWQSCC